MEDYITREEHKEFAKRMEAEDTRQNRRIGTLEETVRQIGTLTTSVEKLALGIENMARELGQQGERLEVLESRDGEMWRKVTGYLVTAIIGAVVGYIFRQIGM